MADCSYVESKHIVIEIQNLDKHTINDEQA